MGAPRAVRFGANVVKSLGQGSRDNGRDGALTCLFDNLQRYASSPVKPFAPNFFTESLVRSGSSFAYSRAFLAKPNGRGFTSGTCRGPNGNPRATLWRAMEAARVYKTKAIVMSGGIGVRQVATTSVGSGRTVDVRTGLNGILEVVRFYGRCYFELSKAPLSFFVVSTAAVGFVMGSGEVVDWSGLAWTSVGTMLAASSANAFNQILEVANDGRMKRTMRRPLPAGRMSVFHASAFAVAAGITGVTMLASKTTALAAELGAANVLLYTLVYTPLKQIHYVNTWVGAVVGAIPPLLGYAAATGQLDAGGWVLASALYFWQLPHFMAIAFLCRKDYAAGGYKMLSLLDTTGKRTSLCALRNCLYLLPLGFLAQHWGCTSGYFGAENFMLTVGIGAASALFYLRPSVESARQLFRTSLLYLPVVMTAMVVHRIPNPNLRSQRFTATDAAEFVELDRYSQRVASSPSGDLEKMERFQQHRSLKDRPLPPISSISAAPFPFLPPPGYF